MGHEREVMTEIAICKICSADANFVGAKQGKFRQHFFRLFHYNNCHFSFIQNPITCYAEIYSEEYYAGKGADPLVDYMYELNHPEHTIRQYELRGIVKAVSSLVKLGSNSRWLDFGCGNGGLVRFCRSNFHVNIFRMEEGWIKDKAIKAGIPILNRVDLASCYRSFDVVTAIEVLEHIENPLETLRSILSFLKPGRLFFYTTGNARPFRNRLLKWPYVVPEVHISFFEPETLARALSTAGFIPEYKGLLPGFEDIIRFKVLKSLGFRKRSWQE